MLFLLLLLVINNINSFVLNPKVKPNVINLQLKEENNDDFDEAFDKRVIQTKLNKRLNDRFSGSSNNNNDDNNFGTSSSSSNDLV